MIGDDRVSLGAALFLLWPIAAILGIDVAMRMF